MIRGVKGVAVVLLAVLVAGVALGSVASAPDPGEHPHVRITDPAAGSTVSGTVTVQGNAWDTDGTVVKVLVGIDARDRTLATDTSGNASWWTWEWVWDTTFFENGWHHIVAIAYDNSSLAADTSIEVYVHNPEDHAPVVVITAPDDGATVRGIVNITGNATDDHAVVSVKIRIDPDGPTYDAQDTSGNGSWWSWRYEWDSRSVSNGPHVIYAKAVDDHGHIGWASIHVTVNNEGGNTPPWVEITEPKQGSTVCGVVVIKGHAGDHDVGDRVEKVQVKIDAGDWQLATDTSPDGSWGSWMFTWDATHADRTWHHVYARSFDGQAYSHTAVLEILVTCDDHGENHRPEVRVDHPQSGEEVHGAVLVHGRAWDPDAGDRVEKVWVRIDDGEWHVAKDLTDNASWFIWGWVWDTTKYDNGPHRVCAKAFDGDLYSELSCIELKVENPDARPKVHIDHPADGNSVHGIVLVHGTASDDHGVKLVQVRIDDREWHNAVDVSSDHSWRTWAWEWDTRGFDNGEHVISARSWDGHQYSEVHRVVVKVENTRGGIVSAFLENPVLTAVLGLGGTFAGSLALWRRRFGLLGSLR